VELVVESDVRVRDGFSSLVGVDDLLPHIAAAQKHMPGVRLSREGAVRTCQGTFLCNWTATAGDGPPIAAGTTVFELSQDARLGAVTGFWSEG
jgi:hypothetical protein